MQIKKIDIVFENTEYVTIPTDDITELYLGDVSKSLYMQVGGNPRKVLTAKKLHLSMKHTANVLDNAKGLYENMLPFKRILKHKDISYIVLHKSDGIVGVAERYNVAFDGVDTNLLQINKPIGAQCKEGLIILIGEGG